MQAYTMALPIALVLLVSALGASASSSSDGAAWRPRPRVEYEFELNGRSLAGLPALQGQYSGVEYRGRVRVQGLTADTAVVKLERMSWSALHGRLHSGWWSAQPEGDDALHGHAQHGAMSMPLSGTAAVVRFQNGRVSSVLVSKQARDWEVNMLQGVLGHMQIQGEDAGNGLHHDQHRRQQEQGVYRVLEDGVSGRCVVQYEVSAAEAPAQMSAVEAKLCAGKPYVQITKTKNFTDCEQYAEQARGLPRCAPGGSACANLWARNSVTQLVGCGKGAEMQLVQAVSSSSMQAELQAREDSRAAVHSAVILTLSRVGGVRERLATPKDGSVLQGLGFRVGGKLINGNWGLNSEYSNSNEQEDGDSVEVIRQHNNHHGGSNESDNLSHDSNDSDNTSESSSRAQHKKHSNNHDSDNTSESSSRAQHKKHSNNHDSDNTSESSSRAQHKKHSDNHKNRDNNSPRPQRPEHNSNGKANHSRRPRSAKSSKNAMSEAAFFEDAFAGSLAPATVNTNATLASELQQRLSQDVAKAAAELANAQGPSTRTMERLSMAIRIARSLSAPALRSVQSQLKDQTAKDLFRDVLAMCGSEACVELTLTAIKERKMPALAAQMALSSLADRVVVPNRFMLKLLQDLYESSSDQQVKIASVLAMGNLAGRAPRAVAAPTTDFLAQELNRQAAKNRLAAPLTFALGTTASPKATQTLVKMAKNNDITPYLRAQAVLALRHGALRAPAQVRDSLLALFHDTTAPASVRMAAVSLMPYARLPLQLWQRLAVSTHYEPNLAVASYVWATIQSFAKMQDPLFRQQTQFARLALPLARSLPQGSHLAFNVVASSVDAQLDHVVHEHVAMMGTADAANAYYRRVTRPAGISFLDQEVDLWGANPDDLLQAAMEAAFGRQDKASARPAVPVPHSTRSLHDKLSIVRRRLQDPQGHLRLTLKPFVNNLFLSFDKETPSRVAKAAAQFLDKLRSESRFHAQQMGGEEVSVSTITEMGFPVNLRIQAPWLVRAQGSAQLHRNHSANANLTCLYTAGLHAQLSVQPSWTSREFLAAVNGHAMIHVPATALHAQMNTTDGRVSVRVEPANERSVRARLATQPLTASLEASRAELASESVSAHNASRVQGGVPEAAELSPWSDVSLSLRAPVERAALPAWLQASRTVLGFPVLGRPLTASRLELVVARPAAVNVSVALVKAMMQSGDLQVVYPASLRQEDASAEHPAGSTTTTEMPSTTTATEEPSTTTEMPSTTTETATTTEADATSAPAVRAARGASAGHRRVGNGSVYFDDGDLDFTRSEFNATTLNPYDNRVNGSSELYVLSQVLAGMSAGRGYVVGVNVTSESSAAAKYTGFWTFGANLGARLMRGGVFVRSDADNAQMAATGAVLRDVPSHANLSAALHQQPAMMMKAEYQQIDATATRKVVTAALETDRSPRKAHNLQQAALEQRCADDAMTGSTVDPACRSVLLAANIPDQFNLTVNYNNPADEAWGSAVHRALQAARVYFWNQDNVAVDVLATGNANELGMGVSVQPDGFVDGWLLTPSTLTKVNRVSAPAAATLFAATSMETGAYCGLNATRLVTLDGAQGDFRLDACWHLLAKDCSGKSRVAVLARADKPKSADLHVEINVDNYQVARLSPDGSAFLNGVDVANQTAQAGAAVHVRDANDVAVMSIVRSEDGAMGVYLPDHGLRVQYANTSVIVQAGASLQGRMCGMCGTFDGNASASLRNAKNKKEKTIQALADSYAVDCKSRN